MASQASSLRLKHIDKHTTYSFSFEGCDCVFEWSVGALKVIERPQYDETCNVIILDERCINLESVVRYTKKFKEDRL